MVGRLTVNEKNARLDRPLLHDAARHRDMSSTATDKSIRCRVQRNEHQNEQVYRVCPNEIGVYTILDYVKIRSSRKPLTPFSMCHVDGEKAQ